MAVRAARMLPSDHEDALTSALAELERLRRELVESQRLAQLGSWEWDALRETVHWSEEMFRLHDLSPLRREPTPTEILGFAHPDDLGAYQSWYERLRADPGRKAIERIRLVLAGGTIRDVTVCGMAEADRHSEQLRCFGTMQAAAAQLPAAQTERLLDQIMASTSDAIYTMDREMTVRSWNPAAERLYGYREPEILGQPVRVLRPPTLDGAEIEASDARVARVLAGRSGHEQFETRRRRKDGTVLEIAMVTSPLLDPNGDVTGMVAAARDVSERRQTDEQIAQLANHDALTGLFNRTRFEEELAEEAKRVAHRHHTAAVLLLDIDNFRYINEAYGHKTGDAVVAGVAQLLRHQLRDTDVLARFGGDAFAVLTAPTSARRARTLAGRLLTGIRAHEPEISGARIRISASIGVVVFDSEDALSAQPLVADVDHAMYRSKEDGRDRITVVEPTEVGMTRREVRHSTEHLIRQALAHDQFALHVQPIVNLLSGLMTHCEVLIRMATGGSLVMPGEFLPAAERLGLIHRVDRWVIDHTLALATQHPDLIFNLNLSGATIDDRGLIDYVTDRFEAHGTDPHQIVFELTETAAVGSLAQARTLARKLAALGSTFAIDDFGTGFSTFYYLKHFPAQYVKIDGEFLSNRRSHMDDLVIDSIVRIARELGKHTVAEYVSDEARLQRVRALGVDLGQGYHFAKPFPAAELKDYPRRLVEAVEPPDNPHASVVPR